MSKTVYYSDELNDDFASLEINTKPLYDGYKFVSTNVFIRFLEFICYFVIAKPLVFLYLKIVYLQKFENKKVLKEAKKSGGYIYANHTNPMVDAFCPNIIKAFRRNYIIVGPDAVSKKWLAVIVRTLGAIPLGSTLKQKKQMKNCVFYRSSKNGFVTIYPEAHIWPFYTKIRPFPNNSFVFPAKDGLPVFSLTNCYQKRKFGKLPKIKTYIDGPFYACNELSVKENQKQLRDKCYELMKKRAKDNSTYAYVEYIKINKEKNYE